MKFEPLSLCCKVPAWNACVTVDGGLWYRCSRCSKECDVLTDRQVIDNAVTIANSIHSRNYEDSTSAENVALLARAAMLHFHKSPIYDTLRLAQNLRNLRQLHKRTLAHVSTAAGISKSYLWELEKDKENKKCPSAIVVYRLALALGTRIETLMFYEFPSRP